MDSTPIPVETLLAHREWVRCVARAVVRDPNAADDVEQETWLAALRTPPRNESSLRGWFGAVTRSRARRIGRTDGRREARESVVARREAAPSAAELAEIADTHRRVVAAVVELDEPYRETILLRYFEGLSIDDVAARTGSPAETTRSRIKRGVAKLRERLERELGTRGRPWHLALVPLVGWTRPAGAGLGTAVGGGVVMASTTKTAIAGAAALFLLGLGAVAVSRWPGAEPRTVASAPEVQAVPAPRPAARPEVPAAAARRPRQRTEEPAPPPAAPPETPKPVVPAETVLQRLQKVRMTADWRDVPFVGVMAELTAKTDVEIVLSQEAADFLCNGGEVERLSLDQEIPATQMLTLVTQLKGLQWIAEEPRVVIVPQGVPRDALLPVIVPSEWTPPPTLTVIGRVTDGNGVVVPGAEVWRVGVSERRVATTDIAGRYEAKLPKPYGSLEARAEGRVPSFAVSVDGQPGAQVTLDLATRGAAGTVVVRLVCDVKPLPNVQIWVGPGKETRTTLPDGRVAVQRPPMAYSEEHASVTFAGIAEGRAKVVVLDSSYEAAPCEVDVVAGKSVGAELRLVRRPSVEERLKKERISFSFRDARAREVVKFLNDAKELSIVMDPALATTIRDRRLTLAVDDRPLDETLRALCREIGGATYVIQGPVVFIRSETR